MRNCFEEIDSIKFTCGKNRILTYRKDTKESYILLCFIKSKKMTLFTFFLLLVLCPKSRETNDQLFLPNLF